MSLFLLNSYFFYSSQFRVFIDFLLWKLHKKNAKVGVLENLDQNLLRHLTMMDGTFRKFPKVKISPLKIYAPWQVWVFNEKRCPEKFRKIHRKTPVQESLLLIKLQARPATLLNNFIKKETLAQVFSNEFCEISKNTFFTEHPWRLLL